jgi:telomere length regulation protein
MTCLILLILSYFRPNTPPFHSLAFSPPFVSGIGVYIGHLDPSVRRCGMLVAEVVALRAGKKLDFGDWEGDSEGRLWSRQMRALMTARDIDADADMDEGGISVESTEAPVVLDDQDTPQSDLAVPQGSGYESDESIVGYASPSSSRSPSPTQAELDEIEKDPTLAVGVKKIPRPVYLVQLGNLIRGPSGMQPGEDNQQADRVEMALDFGEELIRKKSGFGTELGSFIF